MWWVPPPHHENERLMEISEKIGGNSGQEQKNQLEKGHAFEVGAKRKAANLTTDRVAERTSFHEITLTEICKYQQLNTNTRENKGNRRKEKKT